MDSLGKIIRNRSATHTFKLRWMYDQSENYLDDDVRYRGNSGLFEFALLRLFTHNKEHMKHGYKVSDRFGGKGVICDIWSDEKMPIDRNGVKADVIISPPSIIARTNIGQLYEHEINFIASEIIRKAKLLKTIQEKTVYIMDFIKFINKEQYTHFHAYHKSLSKSDKREFIESLFETGLYIHQHPFDGSVTLDVMEELYKRYNIKPSHIRTARFFKNAWSPKVHKPARSFKPEEEYDEEFDNVYLNYKTIITDEEDDDDENEDKTLSDYYMSDEVMTLDEKTHEPKIVNIKDLNAINNLSKQIKHDSPETFLWEAPGGLMRSFKSNKPVIIADKFMIVLKHTSMSKFSVRSVGSVNQSGIPIKSGGAEDNFSPYSKTPIRFGEMDLFNALVRVPAPIINRFMATHGTDPQLVSDLAELLINADSYENT